MYYVYLLQSQGNSKKIYIGCTANLNERLKQHNKVTEGYRSWHRPWKVVYYEAYQSRSVAFEREKQFKRHGNTTARLKARLGL